MERIRFYLDENVYPAIAVGLARYGIDVLTAKQAGMLSRSDEEQLDFAVAERRAIFTHDQDFLRLQHTRHDHFGIIFCNQSSLTVGEMIRALRVIHDRSGFKEFKGRVEYI